MVTAARNRKPVLEMRRSKRSERPPAATLDTALATGQSRVTFAVAEVWPRAVSMKLTLLMNRRALAFRTQRWLRAGLYA